MVFDHIYAAVKIPRTGKVILSRMPNLQRKDEWQWYHHMIVDSAINALKHGASRMPGCGCVWAGAVRTIIEEKHPHLQTEPYPTEKMIQKKYGNLFNAREVEDMQWNSSSTKMTKAEFMTSAGIYIDCGDELDPYPDDELLLVILASSDLMQEFKNKNHENFDGVLITRSEQFRVDEPITVKDYFSQRHFDHQIISIEKVIFKGLLGKRITLTPDDILEPDIGYLLVDLNRGGVHRVKKRDTP